MADDESKAKVEDFPSLEHQLAAENLEGYPYGEEMKERDVSPLYHEKGEEYESIEHLSKPASIVPPEPEVMPSEAETGQPFPTD